MPRNDPSYCPLPSGPLAYSLYGGGRRKAIFFHGHPGSRVQGSLLHDDAKALGFEVAAFDRPGFGHSAAFASSGASPLDLSGALAALADSLGWGQFHLIAVSGGAPYALNSAPALGPRVRSIEVVCGLGPLHEERFRRRFPRGPYRAMRLGAWLPTPALSGLARLALLGHGRRGRGQRPGFLSPGDFTLLQSPEVGPLLRLSLESAFRQGAAGVKRDLGAFLAPWKLDYAAIPAPVTFWHGRDDRLVPWEFSAWLAERIPGSRLFTPETEGHYTLPLRRAREILEKIR